MNNSTSRRLQLTACKRIRRIAAGFSRDIAGVTAIEFGMVAVPFLGLLMAVFQSGMYFLASESLSAVVQDAARKLYTGTAQSAGVTTASSFLSTYVCPSGGPTKLPSFMDCTKLIVDVRVASSFSGIDTGADFYQANATTKFCPGGPGDIVVVRMIYPLPMFAPVLIGSGSVSQSGFVSDVPSNPGLKELVLGTSVFQNEPYQSGTYQASSGC